VDLAAPGGDTSVDQNHDGYGDGVLQQTFNLTPTDFHYFFFQGTSMASPHVAGAAALLISRGLQGSDNVRQMLQITAHDLGTTGWDAQYGYGLLDVAAALNYYLPGDITGDGSVNVSDLVQFALDWLSTGPAPLLADFNNDGIVDMQDFAILEGNWLL
jgi:subtilisin family serine protease